jgi:hypothetical protein
MLLERKIAIKVFIDILLQPAKKDVSLCRMTTSLLTSEMDKEVESLIKTGMTEHFCRYQN